MRRSKIGLLVLRVVLVLSVPFGIGAVWYHLWGPGVDRQLEALRRLAEDIPGVTVHEVDGIRDLGLENAWLDLEFEGKRYVFHDVTTGSFEDTGHLRVSRVGSFAFRVYGFERGREPPPQESLPDACYSMGGTLDFGQEGEVGARLRPPLRSIPEFLARLDEVQRIVEAVPEEYPGVRIGEGEHVVTVIATGEEKVTPLWLFAVRSPAD